MAKSELQGSYPVNISPGVLDYIKKQEAESRNELSDRRPISPPGDKTMFAVRYGFRPDSLNTDVALAMHREEDEYVIAPERPTPEKHVFRGQATSAKTNEYVLVYNQERGAYDLLPLELTVRVNPVREKRAQGSARAKAGQVAAKSLPGQARPSAVASAPSSATSTVASVTPVASAPASSAPASSVSASSASASSTSVKPTATTTSAKARPAPTVLRPAKRTKVPPTASKRPVASKRLPNAPKAAPEDDDDELEGFANELENFLEAEESNHNADESSESDEDEPVELSHGPASRDRPISLRGYVAGDRAEEDDISSSEEE